MRIVAVQISTDISGAQLITAIAKDLEADRSETEL